MNRSSLYLTSPLNPGTGSFTSNALDNTNFPQPIDTLENVLKVIFQ